MGVNGLATMPCELGEVLLLSVLGVLPMPCMVCLPYWLGLMCLLGLACLACLLKLFWLFRTVQNCSELFRTVQNCSELFRTVLGGLGILRWCGITLLKNVVPRPHNFEHWPTVL